MKGQCADNRQGVRLFLTASNVVAAASCSVLECEMRRGVHCRQSLLVPHGSLCEEREQTEWYVWSPHVLFMYVRTVSFSSPPTHTPSTKFGRGSICKTP